MNSSEEFFQKYKPMIDHTGQIRKFSCHGSDLNLVRQMDPDCVWTIVNHYNGTWILEPGYKRAGREYFVICENPFTQEEIESDEWEDIIWHTDVYIKEPEKVDAD